MSVRVTIICDACGATIDMHNPAFKLKTVRLAVALEADVCSTKCLIAIAKRFESTAAIDAPLLTGAA